MAPLTKIEKKKLAEQKKLDQQYKKYEEEMKAQAALLPKVVVRRDIKQNRTCQQRDICIEGVTLTVGSKILLEGGDIEWPWGRRFGLIGKNGIGKT
jgi:ABC-type molybdenum transport system ATPase subunit/photorepair protein PhrA